MTVIKHTIKRHFCSLLLSNILLNPHFRISTLRSSKSYALPKFISLHLKQISFIFCALLCSWAILRPLNEASYIPCFQFFSREVRRVNFFVFLLIFTYIYVMRYTAVFLSLLKAARDVLFSFSGPIYFFIGPYLPFFTYSISQENEFFQFAN